MNNLYKIKPLNWHYNGGIWEVANQLNSYFIRPEVGGYYHVFYGDGKAKEFNSLANAKEWVETVHYPAQVAKIMDIVEQ